MISIMPIPNSLNSSTPPSNISRIYSDFDVNFVPHPVTGDITMVTGTNSVIQALMNLVQINTYEKPFHPEIGSGIRSLLFEPMSPLIANSLKVEVRNLINNFEPRVDIINIAVTPDYENNLFNVIIEFFVLNSTLPITINAFLQRVR